jgi:hypothetical protein
MNGHIAQIAAGKGRKVARSRGTSTEWNTPITQIFGCYYTLKIDFKTRFDLVAGVPGRGLGKLRILRCYSTLKIDFIAWFWLGSCCADAAD